MADIQALLPSGSMVTVTSSVLSSLRFMRYQLRRMLTATLQIDYTVTTTGYTADALVAFLQSASTISQLTTALQASYPGVTISSPTVIVVINAPSASPVSSISSLLPSVSPTGAIIGGVVGGIVVLLLLFLCYRQHRAHEQVPTVPHPDDCQEYTPVVPVTPIVPISSAPEITFYGSKANGSGIAGYNPYYGLHDNPARNPSTSTLPAISWDRLTMDATNPLIDDRGSFGWVFRGVLKQPGQTSDCAIAVKVMSRTLAKAKNLDYEERLVKGREEAELVHAATSRGPRFSECMTFVFGFAQGPLPLSLTVPFQARPGEEAFGIVMRLEEGGSLEHHLYQLGTQFSMAEKICILAGISRGLTALHSIGIVHADLKPANVLLSGDNPPKIRLSDFGLSSLKASSATFASSVEATAHKKGTIKYCAPEMFDLEDGSDQVASASRRTDVYALAVTAWEILVGVRPFVNMNNQHQLEREILKGKRPLPEQLPIATPDRIKEMITDCWDKDRHKRWPASDCFVAVNREYDLLTITKWDIFFSHPWASKPFLSHLYNLLCGEGYTVWYDVHHMGYDLVKSMQEGIENSTVVLVCVDSKYQKRDNCMLELRHAHKVVTQRGHRTKCIIGVMMEDGIDRGANWGTNEVKDILGTKGKMFVNLHELNSPAWEDPDGPTEQMLQELRNHDQIKLLFKMLHEQLTKKFVRQDSGENRAVIAVLGRDLDAAESARAAAEATITADRARYEREQEERMCVICMANPKSIVLLPCGHMCICLNCSGVPSLRNCPMCRADVASRQQIY